MRNIIISSILALSLTACQTVPENLDPPRRQVDTAINEGFAHEQFDVYDPAEGLNKQVYKFNALTDEYFLLPVVDTYKYVAPQFVRTRVNDFFLNIGEVGNFTNSVFQLKPGSAGITLGRFGINTTIGLLGFFDVASEFGIERKPQDFGKTLGYYGAGPGPYVMLPLLGPSNLRDTTGFIVDFVTLSLIVPNDIENSWEYEVVDYGVQPINMRANNDFRYFRSGTAFEYELVRYISATSRQLTVDKNNTE